MTRTPDTGHRARHSSTKITLHFKAESAPERPHDQINAHGSRAIFFIQAHITVETSASLPVIAERISQALDIPEMVLDQSGRHEDTPVHVCSCFGLIFDVGRTDEDPPLTYQLDISSDVDAFDYDGSELEVDATQYVLLLLDKAGIRTSARDPGLLY